MVRLMQSCGKELTSKFSKPKMSSTPMQRCTSDDGTAIDALIFLTHQSKASE